MRHIVSCIVVALTVGLASAPFSTAHAQETPPSVQDIDLAYCLREALQNNFSIRKAREEIERLSGAVGEAGAAFVPKIDLIGSYDRVDLDRLAQTPTFTFGAQENWSVRVQASESIFLGGHDLSQFARARAFRRAGEHALESVVNDVILDVKTRYFGVLVARAQEEVQKQNSALMEEELRIERDRLHAGTVSEFNVLRAEVALANSLSPLIRAQNNTQLSAEQLARAVGRHPVLENIDPTSYRIVGALAFEPYEITAEKALSTAMSSRPELLQLQSLIDAEKQGVWVARSDYLPRIDIAGGYGREKNQFAGPGAEDLKGWQFNLTGRWNLFDGFATTSRVTQAQSIHAAQRLSLEEARLNIAVEVRAAYHSVVNAAALVNASNKVEQQGEEALRLARVRFQSGVSPQLDVLDAQVALTQARTNKVQALHDYNVAVATLERAMGNRVSGGDTTTGVAP